MASILGRGRKSRREDPGAGYLPPEDGSPPPEDAFAPPGEGSGGRGGSGRPPARRRGRGRRGRSKRRYIFLGGGAAAIVVVLLLMVCVVGVGGGPDDSDLILTFDDEEEEADADLQLSFADDPDGGSADGGSPEDVSDQVRATVEAVLALQSTPDFSATLQAQIASNNQSAAGGVISPLESDEERTYISPVDRDYLSAHGPYFWSLALVRLEVNSILSEPFLDWNYEDLSRSVRDMQQVLDRVVEEDRKLAEVKTEGVTPVASEYVTSIRSARTSLDESVRSIEAAFQVFGESAHAMGQSCGEEEGSGDNPADAPPGPFGLVVMDMCPGEIQKIQELYFGAFQAAREIDAVMGLYGCSICGEIFRARSSAISGS